MRIAVAEIAQETDSFTSMVADLKDFETNGLYFGAEILERMRGVGPIGGFRSLSRHRQRIGCRDPGPGRVWKWNGWWLSGVVCLG